MTARQFRARPIDIRRAVLDPDYYADVRHGLRRYPAQLEAFTRAVDEAYDAMHPGGVRGAARIGAG